MLDKCMIVCCVVFVACSNMCAKEYQPGSYPAKYAKITAKEWPAVKQTLDQVLKCEGLEKLQKSPLCSEARFILTRIAEIEWNEKQKQEVVGYLASFVEAFLQEGNLIKDIDKVNVLSLSRMPCSPIYLPKVAISTMLAVAPAEGCKHIQEVWKKLLAKPKNPYYIRLRQSILEAINTKPPDDNIAKCVAELEKIYGTALMTSRESILMERLKLQGRLFALKDQVKAWKLLWDTGHVDTLADALANSQRYKWYYNVRLMGKIYRKPDISVPMKIALSETNLAKKYVFLYWSCFLMNGGISSLEGEVDKKLVEAFFEETKKIYHTPLLLQAMGNKDSVDFLKPAAASLKTNIRRLAFEGKEPICRARGLLLLEVFASDADASKIAKLAYDSANVTWKEGKRTRTGPLVAYRAIACLEAVKTARSRRLLKDISEDKQVDVKVRNLALQAFQRCLKNNPIKPAK